MAVRDSFVVNFGAAGADKLLRATKGIQGAFAKLGRSAGGMSATLSKIAGLTAVVANAGAAIALRNAANRMNEIAVAGQKLGTATDRMQTLAETAEMFGGNMDHVVDAIAEMQRRISEKGRLKLDLLEGVNFSSPQAAKDLQQIFGADQNRQALLGMDPAALFENAMRGLASVNNASQRQFLADELFGGPAQELMAMFNQQGLDALRATHLQNQELGLGMDEQSVQNMRATQAVLTDISHLFSDMFAKIASSPEVLQLAIQARDAIEDTIKQMGGGAQIAKDFAQSIRDVVSAMGAPGRFGQGMGERLFNLLNPSTTDIDQEQSAKVKGKQQVEDKEAVTLLKQIVNSGFPARVAG